MIEKKFTLQLQLKSMLEENQQPGLSSVEEHENQFTGLGDVLPERAKWEVFKGKNLKWYFHLRANNLEIICQSEGYESKENALKGIASIRKNVAAPIFQLVKL